MDSFNLMFFKPSCLEWLEIEQNMLYGIFEVSDKELSLISMEA